MHNSSNLTPLRETGIPTTAGAPATPPVLLTPNPHPQEQAEGQAQSARWRC